MREETGQAQLDRFEITVEMIKTVSIGISGKT